MLGGKFLFFNYVKKAWNQGKIKVGLSADQTNKSVWLEASGISYFAAKFLSQSEKQKLATVAKSDAKTQLEAK